MRRIARGLVVATVVGISSLTATAAMAQEAGESGPSGTNGSAASSSADIPEPAKRVTLTAGFDFATAYMFRGIYQEDRGMIMPPFVDVGVSVYEGEGALKNITLNGGNWNSVHSGSSGQSGHGNAWYEADYYGSATFTVGNWKPGALFTSYTSPNDAFGTVHELAAVIAYDDSASAFPLSPKATFAFELQGQADGGANKGRYLELGVRPVVTLVDHGRYPLSLAIPAKLGLSLKDYYEGPTGSNTFGFFDLGGLASVPLAFLNGRSTWEVHGGVDFLWLGDNMRLLNGGDRVKPVGIVGLSVTY